MDSKDWEAVKKLTDLVSDISRLKQEVKSLKEENAFLRQLLTARKDEQQQGE